MKSIQHKEYILIEVPEAKSEQSQRYRIIANELVIFWNGFLQDGIKLPPGQYEIIGKANELSEEQWRGIVDRLDVKQVDFDLKEIEGGDHFTDYYGYEKKWYVLPSATSSGLSLLAHHKLKPETTLILLTKRNHSPFLFP